MSIALLASPWASLPSAVYLYTHSVDTAVSLGRDCYFLYFSVPTSWRRGSLQLSLIQIGCLFLGENGRENFNQYTLLISKFWGQRSTADRTPALHTAKLDQSQVPH